MGAVTVDVGGQRQTLAYTVAEPIPDALAGASTTARSGETYPQAWARTEATLGPLRHARVFDPGLNVTDAKLSHHFGERQVLGSFKLAPAVVLDGSNDAKLRQYFGRLPDGSQYCYWHEPDDEIFVDAVFTSGDYLAAARRIKSIQVSVNPALEFWSVTMEYSRRPANRGGPAVARPYGQMFDPAVHDGCGFDAYASPYTSSTGLAYRPPAEQFGKLMDLAASYGKPWGLAEYGCSLRTEPELNRPAWLRQSVAWLRSCARPPVFIDYFHNAVGGAYEFDLPGAQDPVSASAWREAVA